MTADPHPLHRLRRVQAALEHGRAPEPTDAVWLADAIDAYLNREAPTLDATLSLTRPGQDSTPTRLARTARDDALRQAARDHFGHLDSCRAQALALRDAMTRYEATAWRYDRHRGASPYPDGSLRDLLWRALVVDVGMPRSARALQSILADV